MSKGKRLLILTAVLVLMACAYLAVTKLLPEESSVPENTTVTALQLDEDSITGISWVFEGETMDFVLVDEEWVYAPDTGFPLKSSFLTKMVDRLSHITASKVFENVEDLSQYGLDTPVLTIRVTTADTEPPIVLTFGDTTTLSQEYYMTMGDGKVYLASTYLYNSFAYSLYDLVQKETIPSMGSVNKIEVSKTGDNEIEVTVEDTERLNTFAEAVSGIAWGDCVAYRADHNTLTEYGLATPALTVTVHYTKTTETATDETEEEGNTISETIQTAQAFTLEMSQTAEGTCYARLPGSGMIYTMDSAIYEAAMALTDGS